MKLRYLTLRFISISRIFFFWKIKCKWHSRILFYFYRKSTATLVWYLHWSTLLRKSSFCTMHLATWSLAQRMWTILWIFKICYWIERDFGDGTTLFTLNWHKVQTGPKSFRGKKKSIRLFFSTSFLIIWFFGDIFYFFMIFFVCYFFHFFFLCLLCVKYFPLFFF